MKNNPTQRVSSLRGKRKNLRDEGVSVAGESGGLEMRVKQLQSRSCSPGMACQGAVPQGCDSRAGWRDVEGAGQHVFSLLL